MNRVFVDMDGVLVDFNGYMAQKGLSGDAVKSMPGAYLDMQPLPGALAAARSLIGMGFEVWIATKAPTGITFAYADKVAWVLKYLPELKRKIIITHDKGLLGDSGDYLIDDRPHKANCEKFKGTLIKFDHDHYWMIEPNSETLWAFILNEMRLHAARSRAHVEGEAHMTKGESS
jgi:5'(3')-deoxyribonucleotidase